MKRRGGQLSSGPPSYGGERSKTGEFLPSRERDKCQEELRFLSESLRAKKEGWKKLGKGPRVRRNSTSRGRKHGCQPPHLDANGEIRRFSHAKRGGEPFIGRSVSEMGSLFPRRKLRKNPT